MMEWWKKFQGGGGLPGLLGGQETPVVPWSDPDTGGITGIPEKVYYQDEFDAQQKNIDFKKEFAQSMFGGKKAGGQDSVGQVAVGGGMKKFNINPSVVSPEVSQYAPTPGFSLVRPLKKKNWYDYGGSA